MPTPIECVRAYLEREWWVIPLLPRKKEPVNIGWSNSRPTGEDVVREFMTYPNGTPNIGMVIQDDKVDVDLDCREAVILAPHFLPRTPAIFGHQVKPRSHWLYQLTAPLDREQRRARKDPTDGRMLIETRTGNNQTMMPGSIHPNGHPVVWQGPNPRSWEPLEIEPDVLIPAVDRLHAATLLARHWGDDGSGRHLRCIHLAGGIARIGWSLEEAWAFIEPILHCAGDTEISDRRRTVEDTYYNEVSRNTTGWRTLSTTMPPAVAFEARRRLAPDQDDEIDLSDLGNARRLARYYGQEIRYCPDMDRWFWWDGRRWARDTPKSIKLQSLAQLVTDRMLLEELPRIGDDTRLRKEFFKFIGASRNMGKTRAMVDQARSLPELLVYSEELDANPCMINCRNGTLNLDTAALQPHEKSDYITKITGCDWRGQRVDQTWESFLHSSTQGNQTVLAFLQRAAGYSIQGANPEERFFMVYGPAGSGKSTFVNSVQKALGEYATSVEASTFTTRGQAGEVREDLVKLRGMHLVTTGEVDEGKSWSAAQLKRLTGNDVISARALYSADIEFTPGFKLWITTNARPVVHDSSEGFWRRVVVIPFEHVVPVDERDSAVKSYLASDPDAHAAILSWCLEGYKLWQREGPMSRMPEEIAQAINDYREDSDPLAEFISECCVVAPGETERAGDLYGSYTVWASRRQITPISQAQFKQSIINRGFERTRRQNGYYHSGVSLRPDAPRLSRGTTIEMTDDPFQPTAGGRRN
jgi:putative DNA primase/helicase